MRASGALPRRHHQRPSLRAHAQRLLLLMMLLPASLARSQKRLQRQRAPQNNKKTTHRAPGWPSEYLFVMQLPSASMTGCDVKFSEAISSMPFLLVLLCVWWRRSGGCVCVGAKAGMASRRELRV